MANPELGVCSVPAPAAGQLLSTQRQTRRGRECAFSLPAAGLLEKILPAAADFIPPLLGDPKVADPRGRGGQESLEEAAGWLVLVCRWGHPSAPSAPSCSPSDVPVKWERLVASAWLSQGAALSPFAGYDLCLVEGFLLSARVQLLWGSK